MAFNLRLNRRVSGPTEGTFVMPSSRPPASLENPRSRSVYSFKNPSVVVTARSAGSGTVANGYLSGYRSARLLDSTV
uniref:Uncharacterized protein n=1 Tax=Steinernema glaseri TaxID=37863 RepID=A0A1I7XXS9_9BILA